VNRLFLAAIPGANATAATASITDLVKLLFLSDFSGARDNSSRRNNLRGVEAALRQSGTRLA
jgi:hypothetical protein